METKLITIRNLEHLLDCSHIKQCQSTTVKHAGIAHNVDFKDKTYEIRNASTMHAQATPGNSGYKTTPLPASASWAPHWPVKPY